MSEFSGRPWELVCYHGIGHSSNTHGCDGCCVKYLTGPMINEQLGWFIDLLTEQKEIAISLANREDCNPDCEKCGWSSYGRKQVIKHLYMEVVKRLEGLAGKDE